MSRTMARRQFLQRSASLIGATAAATTFAHPAFLRGQNLNNKLNIAVIGTGGRGGANLGAVASENIVGLCDVYASALEKAVVKYPNARKTNDFRKLFDHAQEFDAVVVSTCEHTHAFATLPALQLGKHVYCEKPLTYNIEEARKIREAAAKAKVATQMGIQIHSGDNYRRVVELIQAGAIGGVTEAHVWVGRTWGWQPTAEAAKKFGDIAFTNERPSDSQPPPAGLDWDLWLGPAPARPFHNVYFPGPKWYRWWDFGNGTMSDLGSHWNDLPFWALKLQSPLTIEASGPPPHAEIAPASMQATYTYAARDNMPPVKLTWYQGQEKPQLWREKAIPQWDSAVLFVGEKGMLLSDYGKHVLLPEENFKDYKRPDPTIPKSPGQQQEWLNCCKDGTVPSCDFEYSGWLTEANHLGNVAYRAGKKLEWDAAQMKATNCPEADRFIRREYRPGWKLG
jgi:predicted dehydrogenase